MIYNIYLLGKVPVQGRKLFHFDIIVILSNIAHVHYIIILDTDQSYSNVLDTMKKYSSLQ